jgi:phosphatidylcholine synthase
MRNRSPAGLTPREDNGQVGGRFRRRNGRWNAVANLLVAFAVTSEATPSRASRSHGELAAWAVHLFTASGMVLALLALEAAVEDRPADALLWLFAALVIDGLDGTLARRVRIKERLPRIDGEALDLVIDYVTYVFIPALLIWRMEMWPRPLALALASLICLSSLYVFARRDMKTDDGYFRGFPALWNVVALYFLVAPPAPIWAAGIVIVLVVLTFAPVHVAHPFRVGDYGKWLPAIAIVWAGATAPLLWPGLDETLRGPLLATSLASAAMLLGMGLWRSVRRS